MAANAEGDRELKAKVAEATRTPAALPVADLPAMAKTVSGAVYEFPRDASRIDGLSLVFSGKSEAQLKLKYRERILRFRLVSMGCIGWIRMVR